MSELSVTLGPKVTVRLPDPLDQWLERRAHTFRVDKSTLIRWGLEYYQAHGGRRRRSRSRLRGRERRNRAGLLPARFQPSAGALSNTLTAGVYQEYAHASNLSRRALGVVHYTHR